MINIKKLSPTNKEDMLDFWYTLSRNIDASVTLQSKFNSELNPLLTKEQIYEIILKNKEYEEYYKNELKHNDFACGLYKIEKDGNSIGILGGKVEEVQDGKVKSLNLRIHLQKTDNHGKQSSLIQQGIGTKATRLYFNEVFKNKIELHKDGEIIYTVINSNELSKKFQTKIGILKYCKTIEVNDIYYKTKLSIDDFLKTIQQHIIKPKL